MRHNPPKPLVAYQFRYVVLIDLIVEGMSHQVQFDFDGYVVTRGGVTTADTIVKRKINAIAGELQRVLDKKSEFARVNDVSGTVRVRVSGEAWRRIPRKTGIYFRVPTTKQFKPWIQGFSQHGQLKRKKR